MILITVGSTVYAQEQKAIVEYRLEYTDTIKAGDSVLLAVILDVAPGFYIYAPTEMNAIQSLQIMKLTITPSATSIKKAGELVAPQYGLHGPSQVYEGKNVRFIQRFKAEKDIETGAYNLKVRLVTQACNDHLCYPPVTEVMDVPINVIPG
jgi:hypothetical protein